MDTEEAQRLLDQAAGEHDEARALLEAKRLRLYDVVKQVAPALRQVDIVKATGYTREHVYTIINGKRQSK